MELEKRRILSNIRYERALECLASAKSLLESGNYKSAANRSYYAIFHAMRAVLALDEVDRRPHSSIISEFRKRYIKTGIFETELSLIISELFDARTDSDYDDFFVISETEIVEQAKRAEYFLNQIKLFLKNEK
jgi:uncharacterized protein (UPF0332 family)